jgi:hypothetical protein
MKARTALTLATGLAVSLVFAGCSTEAPKHPTVASSSQGRQCFAARDVSSFAFVNESTVNIRVGVSDYYRLDLLSPCTGATFALGVGLRTTGATNFVCDALDAELIVPNSTGIGPQRCPVNAIHKLTAGEVAALGPKVKP